MVQIILHPLRCWECWAAQHQQTWSEHGTLHRSHPWQEHTAFWPLSSCRIFSKENNSIHRFYCQTESSHENLLLHFSDTGRDRQVVWWLLLSWVCLQAPVTISWMSFSVAQGHAQHDAVLRAKLSVERSTALCLLRVTIKCCPMVLLQSFCLGSFREQLIACFPPFLIHLILLHNFQGFSYP